LDLNDTSKDDSESDETPNKEWQELQKSQLVHLGSGRFCIASSFHTMGIIRTSLGNELTFKRSAVFTGVEVMPAKPIWRAVAGSETVRVGTKISKLHLSV
jgi:hypothetical protein